MITIEQGRGYITISGHANFAPIGQDIVCAGVSTLAQTIIASIERLTTDAITYDMQPGWVHIKHGNLSADAQLLVSSFFIGCRMIAEAYPAFVSVTEH